jgi:replicative DNA helicase
MAVWPATIDDVRPVLLAEHFSTPQHGVVFQALTDMHETDVPIDLLALRDWLVRNQQERSLLRDGEDDCTAWLATLAESVTCPENTYYHASLVRNAWTRRALWQLCETTKAAALNPIDNPDETIDRLVRNVEALKDGQREKSVVTAPETLHTLPELAQASALGFSPSCLETLNRDLGGLPRGCVTVIGARPSVGKTALALACCVATVQLGEHALFVSREQPLRQLRDRLAAYLSGRSMGELIHHSTAEDLEAVAAFAVGQLGSGTLWLTDRFFRVGEILSLGRAYARRGVKTIAIDYLQLLEPDRRDHRGTRASEVGEMSHAFKRLALDTGAAVILVSAINRQADKDARCPTLSDFRESGDIEQDGDLILALHRDDKRATSSQAPTMLRVLKNRQGPKRDFGLIFEGAYMRFSMEAVA